MDDGLWNRCDLIHCGTPAWHSACLSTLVTMHLELLTASHPSCKSKSSHVLMPMSSVAVHQSWNIVHEPWMGSFARMPRLHVACLICARLPDTWPH